MTSHTAFRSTLVALGLAAALAPSAWAQPAQTPDAAEHALTREEVIADLTLWRRAGLDNYEQSEAFNPYDSEYLKAKKVYLQWRSGNEYSAELARLRKEAGK